MKQRIATAFALLAAVGLVGALTAPPAYGCSCAAPDFELLLTDSDAMFVGTVVDRSDPVDGTPPRVTVQFEVERWVKGDFGEVVALETSADEASCGLQDPVGRRLGVFVYEDAGVLEGAALGPQTTLCSIMNADEATHIADAMEGLPLEGSLSTEAIEALASSPSQDGASVPTFGMLVGALVVGGVGLWLLRRRSSATRPDA